MRVRLGTRGSALAMAQSRAVGAALEGQGVHVEIVTIRTEGDRLWAARLAEVGGKGLFVREIEEALLGGDVDLAVHSLKDLPAELPPGLMLGAFPPREDPRDVLVSRDGADLTALPPGAVVGTSSPRRRALVLELRRDLVVAPIRGNVDTRLRKLDTGDCAAVLLAAAGLRRLGLAPPHAQPLDVAAFVPAVGQGIVAVEVRDGDAPVRALVGTLDDTASRVCAVAERAYLRRLGASCNTPMAGYATLAGDLVTMRGLVASEDGRQVLRGEARRPAGEAEALGVTLAESLLARGAASITALVPERGRS